MPMLAVVPCGKLNVLYTRRQGVSDNKTSHLLLLWFGQSARLLSSFAGLHKEVGLLDSRRHASFCMESLTLLVLQTKSTRYIHNFPGAQSLTRHFAYLWARFTHNIQLAPPLDNLARVAQLLDRRADSHAASTGVNVTAAIKPQATGILTCRPDSAQARSGLTTLYRLLVAKCMSEIVEKPCGRPNTQTKRRNYRSARTMTLASC